MSFGYRRPAIAVGLALLGTVALAQQPGPPALKGQPVPEAGQKQRAQDSQQGATPKEQGGSDLLSAIKGVETAIREHVAKEDKAESERKEKREIADLEAQQDMAFWAKGMFWATLAALFLTFGGLALTAIGVLLLHRTLGYTRIAAEAAKEAVEEARKATKAADATNAIVAQNAALEVRAYVSVLPAGINQLIDSNEVMGHVDIRNVGKLPARNVWVNVRMRIDNRDDMDGKETTRGNPGAFLVPDDPKDADPGFGVDRAIQPETEMRQGAARADVLHVVDLLNQRDRYVYVWGVVYYDDGWGRRFTRFRHRYAIASHVRRDFSTRHAQETRAVIEVDKARFHPFGNSAN